MTFGADSSLVDPLSCGTVKESSENAESGHTDTIESSNIFKRVRSKVAGQMSRSFDFVGNLFGVEGAAGESANSDGTANTFMKASFMGLVVGAIVVILLKQAPSLDISFSPGQ